MTSANAHAPSRTLLRAACPRSVVATFTNNQGSGDLDMRLLDANGVVIARSESFSDDEILAPPGNLPAGSYTVEIYGFNDQVENNYDLRVDVVAP